MATNSSIAVTEGSGKNIASYSVSETTTKELQRIVLNNSSGTEMGTIANPLVVSATIDTTGLATSAKQDTGNTSLSTLAGIVSSSKAATKIADGDDTTLGAKADAKSTATDTTAITIMQVLKQISASVQAPPSQAVTGTFWQATQPVSVASGGIASGGVASGAIASGAVASGAVASGAYASGSISDGAVVTLGTKTDAKSTATDGTSTSIVSILKQISAMAQAPAALPSNQSVNVAQINGVTTQMGAGASGTGTQRIVTATDSTIGTVTAVTTLTNQTQEGGVNISLNAGAVDTGTRRVVQANGAGKTITSAGGSAASNGNNTLVAAGTNKLKVFAFSLSTTITTAMTCIFQSGAGGTELWRVILQAPTSISTGANLSVSPPAWLFATASATLLNLNLSSANAVHWSVSYFDEA